MDAPNPNSLSQLPSVDRVLGMGAVRAQIDIHGRQAVLGTLRTLLDELRAELLNCSASPADIGETAIARTLAMRLEHAGRLNLRPVINLTGTVLHTNLGRAPLPEEAVQAVVAAMRGACNLEYDLDGGGRGDRDDLVAGLLTDLTGCEAATIVNNNAAAVLLTLNTLANRREVIVSRGEQIEIGGAFRMPDIMARAGCRLREVGTTNRTHLADYAAAIGPKTALILKVHTSNYAVQGYTSSVDGEMLGALARERGVPLMVDLGSGALVDLSLWGLPRETLPQQALAQGAGVVSFSGDKLLGGPQAGIILGDRALIARIKKNPLKRALRVDKMTLAALEAVLRLYRDPDRLAGRLTTLRLLTRPAEQISAAAERLRPQLESALAGRAIVTVEACASQIGSGALPVDLLPSHCLALRPAIPGKREGRQLDAIAAAFRQLPVPVIGRIAEGAFRLDLRCLADEAEFSAQLALLREAAAGPAKTAS